ncbi:hypothetical protein Tco_1370887 [Tanacetum coccineum]
MLTCRRTSQVRSHHQNSREAGMSKDMSGSKLLASSLRSGAGTKTYGGPTEPVLQKQKTHSPSPAFIKENIDVLRTMIKEHDQQAKMKATPRKLAYANSDKEAPAKSLARRFFGRFSLESSSTSNTHRQTHSASKSQRTPYKNKEPTHLRRSRRLEDRSITKEKARRERSKYRRKRSRHQETSSNFEHEEAFMHGHGHPELAKMLNDKIPKTVDEMFKRARAFIRGEVAVGSAEMVRPSQGEKWYVHPAWTGVPKKAKNRGGLREARRNMGVYTPYPRKDTFTSLIKTSKEILAMEKNRGSHGLREVDSSSEGHPLEQPVEWELRKERRKEGIIEGDQVQRILVDGGSLSEIMYEHFFKNLNVNIRSRLRRCRTLMIGFSKETYHPLGVIDLRLTMGKEGEELAALMGYPYKCFLQLSKDYIQIRMAEDNEEKTRFHTEEGVCCFTHMLKELKNSAPTLQRMMDKVLADQRG